MPIFLLIGFFNQDTLYFQLLLVFLFLYHTALDTKIKSVGLDGLLSSCYHLFTSKLLEHLDDGIQHPTEFVLCLVSLRGTWDLG